MYHTISTRYAVSTTSAVDDYGPQLNLTIWFLSALSAVLLGLRVYCKLWRARSLWWDDYVLVASWVALVVSAALQSVCVSYGLGKHNRDIPPQNISAVSMFSYAAGFASVLAAVWSKTSFAMTLLRISDGWTRRFVCFIIISVNLVLGANGAIQWVQCWPVEKLWHPKVRGSCWPSAVVRDYNTFVSVYSGTMDIVLALLPWKIIWKVAIDKKEKMGALFAMSMGVFAGITSFLKITALSAIGNSDIATTVNLFIFGTAEGAITIMAASIPILRALIHRDARPPPSPRFLQLDEDKWTSDSFQAHEKKDAAWEGKEI